MSGEGRTGGGGATYGGTAPVLLLVYNRPRHTALVMERIRAARPPRLYVAADGPRADREDDRALCEQARREALAVDWPCAVQTLLRDANLGCRRAVSGALDWFFDHEEEGIVLEDDALPSPSFFRFAAELLERYRADGRVMMISGNNFQMGRRRSEDSYYFSRYPHCVGWAGWRRAWRHYDRDLSAWPALRDGGGLADLLGSRAEARYWTGKFEAARLGEVDSWAYRWTLSCWVRGGLTVLPSVNLVANTGFGGEATHTRGDRSHPLSWLPDGELDFPLRHPPRVERDARADRRTHRTLFEPTLLRRALRRAGRLLRGGGPR